MKMNTTTDTLLPIVIEGHTFKPNAEGLWDHNEIHRGLGLPDSKAPSQWRNAVADELRTSANLQSFDGSGTFGTEAGTIAYAMWVSTSFYLMVVNAFVAMRNIATKELRHKDALLDANMPKASTLDMKARGAGLTWTEACRVAGIQQPRLAQDALVSMGAFVYSKDNFGTREGSPRPHKSGFEKSAFVRVSSDYGNREGWRVKPRGLDWLRGKAEEINLRVAEEKAHRDRAKRTPKASRINQLGRVFNQPPSQ